MTLMQNKEKEAQYVDSSVFTYAGDDYIRLVVTQSMKILGKSS